LARRSRDKADGDGGRPRSSGETLRVREGGETEGKRAGDDVHLHAELPQWAGATEQRQSGTTAACSSLAAKGGGAARVARARRRWLQDMQSLGHGVTL
jgi:hypothetical protein